MTTDDPLSRLRAGLDEDERIARAAAEAEPADSNAGQWFVDGRNVGGAGVSNGNDRTVCYNESYPLEAQAEHITRQPRGGRYN